MAAVADDKVPGISLLDCMSQCTGTTGCIATVFDKRDNTCLLMSDLGGDRVNNAGTEYDWVVAAAVVQDSSSSIVQDLCLVRDESRTITSTTSTAATTTTAGISTTTSSLLTSCAVQSTIKIDRFFLYGLGRTDEYSLAGYKAACQSISDCTIYQWKLLGAPSDACWL